MNNRQPEGPGVLLTLLIVACIIGWILWGLNALGWLPTL
jgi:hypothetical protein